MKKLFIFTLLLLPLIALAQKEDLVSVNQYLEKYSNVQGYKSVNINKQMLNELEHSEDVDDATKKLLSKLEFVQILEYKPKKVSAASSIAGVSNRSLTGITRKMNRGGNIYYIEGIRVRGDRHLLGGRAKSKIDLSDFKQIVETEQDGYSTLFRKKTFGSKKSEYLLLNGNKIVSLKGKLRIDNLEKFEELEIQLDDLLEVIEMADNSFNQNHLAQIDDPKHKSNEVKSTKSIDIVEEMPKFQGKYNLAHFRKYIQKRIVYPEKAKNKYLTGAVFASFVINKEGQIEQIKILRSLSPELDEEVVRVLKESPMWRPAMRRGKPVEITMSIPVKIK